MANIFNSVRVKVQRKNKFNLSFASRLTTEFGRLTPIMCEEVLPNDTFKLSTAVRIQYAPMKFPVMQKFTAYLHYFFVARRLIDSHWEEFITRGDDGLQELPYPVVKFSADFNSYVTSQNKDKLFKASSLLDYLGFNPPLQPNGHLDSDIWSAQNLEECHDIDINPFRAYHLICNEWYNDETLSKEVEIYDEVNGILNNTLSPQQMINCFELRHRAWRKDYFTSALPDPQRGPDVTLPIFGDMEVTGQGNVINLSNRVYPADGSSPVEEIIGGGFEGNGDPLLYPASSSQMEGKKMVIYGETPAANIANKLSVDSEGVRSATINEVRRAFALQRWYELAARAGNRYVEQILAHFGIRSSDARLQRPQYIGGAVVPVNVGDILQTSESSVDGTPLGTPAGIAQALGRSKPIRFRSEEHGYIIGILSVIPEASYPQGTPRKFLRRTTFDFAWPLLANIGEQEIKQRELYEDLSVSPADNDKGFGYAPRYAEYKYNSGQVHGDFRTSLRDFHDARFFDRAPRLNEEFITVNTDNDGDDGLNRIFAVRSSQMADHLWVHCYNDILVRRVLPKYGTPV